MPNRRRAVLILAILVLLALASFGAALAAGSIPVAAGDIVAALLGRDAPGADIIRELRLPRALAGFACGGLLALAGALMQVLLRNPLADPYILGISGGAGAGALLAILIGLPALAIDGLAFAGALGAMLLVFGLAHGDGSFGKRLAQLARLDLLILDDFAIAPIAAHERNDLLELLDDRVGTRSTLITSQLPVAAWHAWLDEPTLADAILDRIVHGSHKIALKGESMRKLAKTA